MSKNLFERRIARLEQVAMGRLRQRYGRVCVPLSLNESDFDSIVPHLSPVGRDFKAVGRLPESKDALKCALENGEILLLHGVAWACIVQDGDDASCAIAETQKKMDVFQCLKLG